MDKKADSWICWKKSSIHDSADHEAQKKNKSEGGEKCNVDWQKQQRQKKSQFSARAKKGIILINTDTTTTAIIITLA